MTSNYSRKKLDLTGQRFGKLTVLRPAENKNKRTTWRCRCDCGSECIVTTRNLRAGKTKSCGCIGGGLSHLTMVDGTCLEMLQAKTVRKNNRSGVPGVEWRKNSQRWRATICFKGHRYYLGSYERFTDAVVARRNAEAELHDTFVENHVGGAARLLAGDKTDTILFGESGRKREVIQ